MPAAGLSGVLIGISVGSPMPVGLVSAGSRPTWGTVRPGLVRAGSVSDGSVAAATSGVVRPGVVSPGEVRLGVVSPGEVRPGVVSPGEVRPGVVRPGEVRLGVVNAGEVRLGVVSAGASGPACTGCAPAGLRPVGSGGRLIPNCDRPACRADMISLGRSVTTAARVNSRLSGAAPEVSSMTPMTANGLATARAAAALRAVEILRRRWFGTGVSSI